MKVHALTEFLTNYIICVPCLVGHSHFDVQYSENIEILNLFKLEPCIKCGPKLSFEISHQNADTFKWDQKVLLQKKSNNNETFFREYTTILYQ